MENLFLQVMTISEREEIDTIKTHKAFAKRLVDDLKRVFEVYTEVRDDQNYSVLHIGKTANQRYDKPRFYADNKGIRFYARVLGYRDCSFYGTELNDIFLRNKNSRADLNFLSEEKSGHGYVDLEVNIPLTNFDSQLRDIMTALKILKFNRKF